MKHYRRIAFSWWVFSVQNAHIKYKNRQSEEGMKFKCYLNVIWIWAIKWLKKSKYFYAYLTGWFEYKTGELSIDFGQRFPKYSHNTSSGDILFDTIKTVHKVFPRAQGNVSICVTFFNANIFNNNQNTMPAGCKYVISLQRNLKCKTHQLSLQK